MKTGTIEKGLTRAEALKSALGKELWGLSGVLLQSENWFLEVALNPFPRFGGDFFDRRVSDH